MYYSKIRIILPKKHILKYRITLNKIQPKNGKGDKKAPEMELISELKLKRVGKREYDLC